VLGCEREIPASDFTPSRSIELALVNNMPDSALEATERQFAELLAAASGDLLVRFKLFSLPGVPRAETARRYLGESYSAIESLWNSRPDGLIVTGTEPRAASLTDEPYWPALSQIVDWAQHATVSTIWSCLAAHAAVLRIDGVGRHLLQEKRSGVFECSSMSDHPMAAGMPRRFSIPHSRCNDLDQNELTACGYTVLSRSAQAGVDSFVKQTRSTFVFFQGHPEYDSGTLFREYRRDVARFLSGERDTYPAMPEGYFGDDAKNRLTTFRECALVIRNSGLLADFPAVEQEVANTWRVAATQIYRHWLASIMVEKECRLSPTTRMPSQKSGDSTAPYEADNVITIERDRVSSFSLPAAARSRSATKRSRSTVTTPAGRPKA
jgi:homoserine O-succinyltransferase